MFAGKSSELLRRVTRLRFANKNVLVIKHAADVRYNQRSIVTHGGNTLEANVVVPNLAMATKAALLADVIAIDEAQFFKYLAPWADTLANLGKIVIAAGLDASFDKAPFEPVLALIPRYVKLMDSANLLLTLFISGLTRTTV